MARTGVIDRSTVEMDPSEQNFWSVVVVALSTCNRLYVER